MFVLKKRKYTWLDMFYIPFCCAPVSTIVVTLQKAVTAFVNVMQVVVVAEFVDSVVAAVTNRTLDKGVLMWFVVMVLMVSWKRVSYNIGRLFTNHIVIKGNEQFLNECTAKRSRLHYYLLENPDTEELMNRITDKLERNLNEMLQRFLNFFVIYIPRIVGVLAIIGMHVWWLAIVVTVMTVPLIIVSLRGGKKIYRANEEAAVYERRHRYFFDVLTGRDTVEERSMFGYVDSVNQHWHNQYDIARKINFKAETMFTASINGGSALTSVLSSVIALIMVPLVAAGDITIGLFISLVTAVYDLVNLMGWEMSKAVSQIARFREYMKDLTQFAVLPERQIGDGVTAQKNICLTELQELEFKHVTFRYPGSETDILRNFSMKLEKGKHYAIVGENGAGKSTFIKLLTGLYTDYEGEILLNGKELRSYNPEEWKDVFSGVYQDFAKYYISVEDNIQIGNMRTMYDVEAKRRMHNLAESLGIHEAITSLRHRYATRLGKLDDDSVDLSGGQWQKVAMARALMNDAPLLILDVNCSTPLRCA